MDRSGTGALARVGSLYFPESKNFSPPKDKANDSAHKEAANPTRNVTEAQSE
jgi:hypothetical protein